MSIRSRYLLGTIVVLILAIPACSNTTPQAVKPTPTTKASASPDYGKLEVRYDQLNDRTLIRIRPPQATSDRPQLIVGATVEGRVIHAPETVLLGFRSSAKGWQFADCRSMDLNADGHSLGQSALRRETQIGRGELSEYLYALLPFDVARQLADASQVRVTLCQQNFRLSAEDLANIRAFVDRLTVEAKR